MFKSARSQLILKKICQQRNPFFFLKTNFEWFSHISLEKHFWFLNMCIYTELLNTVDRLNIIGQLSCLMTVEIK